LKHEVFSHIHDLIEAFADADRVFIDIPIGLPWREVPVRPCDQQARDVLGNPRKSSVFPVPCREALVARGLDDARATNRSHIGRSLSEQSWGISAKIAQVDELLLSELPGRLPIREVHPEVCFWAFAGRRAMQHKKSTQEGREERLATMTPHEPRIRSFLDKVLQASRRHDVQADDILDAAVALLTAEARHGKLASLTGIPTHDLAGLPMEMVFLSLGATSK
jgi:predicted RNase H-like nuclease